MGRRPAGKAEIVLEFMMKLARCIRYMKSQQFDSEEYKRILEIIINAKTSILQKPRHVLKYQPMGGILCEHVGEKKKHIQLICNFKRLIWQLCTLALDLYLVLDNGKTRQPHGIYLNRSAVLFTNGKINCKEFMLHRTCLMCIDVNSCSEKSCEHQLPCIIVFRLYFLLCFVDCRASLGTQVLQNCPVLSPFPNCKTYFPKMQKVLSRGTEGKYSF